MKRFATTSAALFVCFASGAAAQDILPSISKC
jgi:hypothetical protein